MRQGSPNRRQTQVILRRRVVVYGAEGALLVAIAVVLLFDEKWIFSALVWTGAAIVLTRSMYLFQLYRRVSRQQRPAQ